MGGHKVGHFSITSEIYDYFADSKKIKTKTTKKKKGKQHQDHFWSLMKMKV